MNALEPDGHPMLGSFLPVVCPGDGGEGGKSDGQSWDLSCQFERVLCNKPKPSSQDYKDTSPVGLPTIKNKQTNNNYQTIEWLVKPQGPKMTVGSRHSLGLFLTL